MTGPRPLVANEYCLRLLPWSHPPLLAEQCGAGYATCRVVLWFLEE